MFDKETLRKLKQKAGIEPYQRLEKFKANGRKATALCPFHDDQNPSFNIWQDDGEYKWGCYPCGKDSGGDVIEFIMKQENLLFPAAVVHLAKMVGFELPEIKVDSFKYDAEKAAARLSEAEGYLKSFGIPLELAADYKLGVIDHPRLGTSLVMPYNDTGAVKIRALNPKDKDSKFTHLKEHPTNNLLFGMEAAYGLLEWEDNLYITESERDAMTMVAAGFNAVSVSSASPYAGKDGASKLVDEHRKKLEEFEHIFLCFDMDSAGQKCADAFENALPSYKTFRITWPYEKGAPGMLGAKDLGDRFKVDSANFASQIKQLTEQAFNRPPAWRPLVKTYEEAKRNSGKLRFLVKGLIPEGIVFLAGAAGSGKTWLALSLAKALVTGRNFLGVYETEGPQNVLYLSPEAGTRSIIYRLDTIRLTENNPRFMFRTIEDGTLRLNDPLLLQAVKGLKPVIFLDTMIRFISGTDENDASQLSKNLSDRVIDLRKAGAPLVVPIHHATKADAKMPKPKLESILRGSGDLGALADAVYGIRQVDKETMTVKVWCLKARDFEEPSPFSVQGKPYLSDRGDLVVLANPQQEAADRLVVAIEANLQASLRELERKTGINKDRISRIALGLGWKKEGSTWTRTGVPELVPAALVM
jgi:AAA domain/CHC2 zinc finger/Toprim-like